MEILLEPEPELEQIPEGSRVVWVCRRATHLYFPSQGNRIVLAIGKEQASFLVCFK